MGMVAAGQALCVPGNHENKLLRALRGRNVQVTHGLAESLAQLARASRPSSARGSRGSSTGWSRTTCWTAAAWSWRTPG